MVLDDGGNAREREGRLRDVISRICLNAFGELGALPLRGMRTDQHPVATGFVGRLHDQFVQVLDHVLEIIVLRTNVSRHVGKNGRLIEIILNDAWNVGVNNFVVGNTRPRRVGQRDVAGFVNLH